MSRNFLYDGIYYVNLYLIVLKVKLEIQFGKPHKKID